MSSIENKLLDLFLPVAEALGYEILRIKLSSHDGKTLQIMLDKQDEAITIDDCITFSKKISVLLEESDPISSKYFLEVSSPGINRPLITLDHFERFKGNPVKIKVLHDLSVTGREGQHTFIGILIDVKGSAVVLDMPEGDLLEIDFSIIKNAKLNVNVLDK